MYTVAEFSKLIQNPLQKGIVSLFAETSPVLQVLPFVNVNGSAYSYNVEKTLPTVDFRDYNEDFTESTGTADNYTETLRILNGKGKLDRAMVLAQGSLNDLRATEDRKRAKALAHRFTKNFFLGNNTTNSKEFNGLQQRLKSEQVVSVTGAITLADVDKMIDSVTGTADAIFCSKSTRRKICDLVRSSGQAVETVSDIFGKPLSAYAGIPMYLIGDDHENNNILGDDIYACRFGAQEYLSGLQCKEIQVYDEGLVGSFWTTHIEWLCSIALFHPKAAARIAVTAEEPTP